MTAAGPSPTVGELLSLLREALAALVPIAERAGIPWRDTEAYDDWDAIASALYANIVARKLGQPESVRDVESLHWTFSRYDLLHPSYAGLSFISVKGPEIPSDALAAFVGFAAGEGQFSDIKWIEINAKGEIAGSIRHASCSEASFSVVHMFDERNE